MTAPDAAVGIDACWNRIGVWSHPPHPCEKLQQFDHCQRCPVYAGAAGQLRDRPLPPDYAETWRRHYAQPLPARDSVRAGTAALVFRLGGELLALPLALVAEVINPAPAHRLTRDLPGPVQSLVGVHGRLRPCLDLAALLELEPMAGTAAERRGCYPRMVVIRRQLLVLVFAVDEVLGVQRYAPADLAPLPGTLSRAVKRFSLGLLPAGEQRAGLLDGGLLFDVLTGKLRA